MINLHNIRSLPNFTDEQYAQLDLIYRYQPTTEQISIKNTILRFKWGTGIWDYYPTYPAHSDFTDRVKRGKNVPQEWIEKRLVR